MSTQQGEAHVHYRWDDLAKVLHIPSGVPHMAEALEDTLDLDVFAPPRADWLDGTDTYLRALDDAEASRDSQR